MTASDLLTSHAISALTLIGLDCLPFILGYRYMPLDGSSETSPNRHPQYYLEDGDCAIRVEDTLFRVHAV